MLDKDILFFRNLREVINALQSPDVLPNLRCMYGEIYTIKHDSVDNWHSVRIQKTPMFFNYWGYGGHGKFIAAVDYTICNTCIKINHLCVNDDADDDMTGENSRELISGLIRWVETDAKRYNKSKLIVALENNLDIYRKYYSNNGFVLSPGNYATNPIWIEMEMHLTPT